MIRQPIKQRTRIVIMIASIVTIILAYSWMSHRQKQINAKDTTIPNFHQFVEGWKLITEKDVLDEVWLWSDLWATYNRHFSGMVIGVIAALIVGLGMAVWRPTEAWFEVPVDVMAKIPPTAMLPVYFVLFGTEYKMFVAMVALGIFPALTQAIYMAAKDDVSDHAVYKAYTLGASHFEAIYCVVYKQILPRFIEAIRAAVGPAMVFLIAAEMLVADEGFGYRLRIQGRLLNFNVVLIYLAILGITGYFINWVLKVYRRWQCPWFGDAE
jgi:NitT/TauT family transport system permease protein